MIDTQPPPALGSPLDGALWLVRRGFAVFPADHPGGDQCTGIGRGHDPATCADRGKHPSVAFTTVHTRDEDRVHREIGGQLQNVGVSVGACTGPAGQQLIVLDSDRPGAIEDATAAFGQQHEPTMRVLTAKGYHDYYWAPAEAKLGNRLGALKGKFDGDVRAGNAYVIGPGSVHQTGVVYTLEDPDVPPAAAPDWLLDALQARPAPTAPATNIVIPADRHDLYTRKVVQAECDSITEAPEGDQNNTINTAAFNLGTLVGAGALSENEAREDLLTAARAGNHPEGRALATITSGLRAGMAQPRRPWPPVARADAWARRIDFSDLIPPHDPDDWTEEAPPAEESAPEHSVLGLLPESFYAARPELQHIRQAGHSRNRSGDVAFLATLTRLSGMVSHRIRADTGVAGFASLNLFGGIVGPSGIGKSSGVEVSDRLMPPPANLDFRDGLPIGSGEGVAEIFMDTVEEETGEVSRGRGGTATPVTRKVRKQVRHNAFFYVDEGATITRLMKERSGSTLGETLRSAAVGQTLGQTNASKETSRYIPSGSYSMGMLVGFQPETAAPLFEEVAEGTPQRFLWVQVVDPSIPDEQPAWPGELLDWRPAAVAAAGGERDGLILVSFDQGIKDELRRADLAKARGETSVGEMNPLDSHAPLMRVKVASLLAILAGRRHVNAEDWELARVVWQSSCATRDAVLRYSEGLRRREQEQRTQARIVEEVRVEQAKVSAEDARAEKAVDRIALRVAVRVRDNGPLTRKEVRAKCAGRDKRYVNDAIAYAELREWVADAGGKLGPGPVPPS
ncbi:bifunctional DNA primase/polymerase [Streptomyces sp. H27-C3]|uniref:bifunctional DNA primase/polymerase n=1 Tax=Streptomyces sp. H27-C3 TaxID=3046305 RepID=UPI0024BA526F|nr:bifunctional DNA primase/polymerase [Streptomyces sp. H27-C3]MDJ0461583.1 bifunctional DNA primase/polymerase [Streptomyces sp. H27-C3]